MVALGTGFVTSETDKDTGLKAASIGVGGGGRFLQTASKCVGREETGLSLAFQHMQTFVCICKL